VLFRLNGQIADGPHPAGLLVAGIGCGGNIVQILLPLQQRRLLACQALLGGARVAPGLQGTRCNCNAIDCSMHLVSRATKRWRCMYLENVKVNVKVTNG
jgi:hypothetical protein